MARLDGWEIYEFRVFTGNSEHGMVIKLEARNDAEATALLRRKVLERFTIIDLKTDKQISIQL